MPHLESIRSSSRMLSSSEIVAPFFTLNARAVSAGLYKIAMFVERKVLQHE
jgi:hypothetical protein